MPNAAHRINVRLFSCGQKRSKINQVLLRVCGTKVFNDSSDCTLCDKNDLCSRTGYGKWFLARFTFHQSIGGRTRIIDRISSDQRTTPVVLSIEAI